MKITVGICTFNRAESLRRTLESLILVRVPKDVEWEVLIINNNCTDHTDDVIAGFSGRLPIRSAIESRQGQSHARNCVIDNAKGEYLIWTDDDVVVDTGWVEAYVEAFRQHAEAVVFGGPIRPRYEAPVAKWVTEGEAVLGGPYAIRCFGKHPVPLSIRDQRLPYGANFAVRTAEQRNFRYDPTLGLGPGRRGAAEEIEVIERLLRSGMVGCWVPMARVEHCIGRNRQTISYVIRHFAGGGETDAFLRRHTGPRWFGVPRWMLRRLFEEWLRYRLHRVISPPSVWLLHLREYSYAWGAVSYYLGISRRR